MRLLRAALLVAAGCTEPIIAGDLPGDASVVAPCDGGSCPEAPTCDAACAGVCFRCPAGEPSCDAAVYGACSSEGNCELQAQMVCRFGSPSPAAPDPGCIGHRCGDECACGSTGLSCPDGGPMMRHCDDKGACTRATPSCPGP